MSFLIWTLLLLVPLAQGYPRHYSTDLNDFLNLYLRQREGKQEQSNENSITRRQPNFRLMPLNYLPHQQHQQQQPYFQQPTCLPAIWTCGPNLPPCCSGLICYDGNAKRGRHCVARG